MTPASPTPATVYHHWELEDVTVEELVGAEAKGCCPGAVEVVTHRLSQMKLASSPE